MGHAGVGWGGSCRRWGGGGVSCRGVGVGHAEVGWVMQGVWWGGSCSFIHVEEFTLNFL